MNFLECLALGLPWEALHPLPLLPQPLGCQRPGPFRSAAQILPGCTEPGGAGGGWGEGPAGGHCHLCERKDGLVCALVTLGKRRTQMARIGSNLIKVA